MTHVLFVCLGNICRSPMAEAVFRHKRFSACSTLRPKLRSEMSKIRITQADSSTFTISWRLVVGDCWSKLRRDSPLAIPFLFSIRSFSTYTATICCPTCRLIQ
ncbi:hypothetical protein BRIN106911_04805 [Brevibacillus invocatus]